MSTDLSNLPIPLYGELLLRLMSLMDIGRDGAVSLTSQQKQALYQAVRALIHISSQHEIV